MNFIGIDLEGVLVPEIWVALSEFTGVKDLKLTTKDVSNYRDLMKIRIDLLNKHKIKSNVLFEIAKKIEPFEGAKSFLCEIRKNYQVIVLSDTFFNLSSPIFKKLNYPTVFCHELVIDKKGMVNDINLCIENHKKLTLKCMNQMNFNTIAIGDSFNDIGMLCEANYGILFCSNKNIQNKFPSLDTCDDYSALLNKINNFFQ